MAQRLVRAAVVVEGNPIGKPLVQLATVGIALEINILVLECLSGKILNPLNQLWFKSGGLIRGDDVDATEPQTL